MNPLPEERRRPPVRNPALSDAFAYLSAVHYHDDGTAVQVLRDTDDLRALLTFAVGEVYHRYLDTAELGDGTVADLLAGRYEQLSVLAVLDTLTDDPGHLTDAFAVLGVLTDFDARTDGPCGNLLTAFTDTELHRFAAALAVEAAAALSSLAAAARTTTEVLLQQRALRSA